MTGDAQMDTINTVEIWGDASAEKLSALSDLELDAVVGDSVTTIDAASPNLFKLCYMGKHFANAPDQRPGGHSYFQPDCFVAGHRTLKLT
jgi:hypothetical protein